MRIDILKQMVERMKKIPDELLDMCTWKCGTIGCVIGHCWDLIPGMKLEKRLNLMLEVTLVPVHYSDGKTSTSIEAAAAGLEISYTQARHLFSPSIHLVNNSRVAVIKRLEDFIANPCEI